MEELPLSPNGKVDRKAGSLDKDIATGGLSSCSRVEIAAAMLSYFMQVSFLISRVAHCIDRAHLQTILSDQAGSNLLLKGLCSTEPRFAEIRYGGSCG
jgi:hypothetical protein